LGRTAVQANLSDSDHAHRLSRPRERATPAHVRFLLDKGAVNGVVLRDDVVHIRRPPHFAVAQGADDTTDRPKNQKKPARDSD